MPHRFLTLLVKYIISATFYRRQLTCSWYNVVVAYDSGSVGGDVLPHTQSDLPYKPGVGEIGSLQYHNPHHRERRTHQGMLPSRSVYNQNLFLCAESVNLINIIVTNITWNKWVQPLYSSIYLGAGIDYIPLNTKHLYNICTMLAQRRSCTNVIQMFVSAGYIYVIFWRLKSVHALKGLFVAPRFLPLYLLSFIFFRTSINTEYPWLSYY